MAQLSDLNRGRLRWEDMRKIDVPIRDVSDAASLGEAVKALESTWEANRKFRNVSESRLGHLVNELKLEGADSRIRWLAYKPPERATLRFQPSAE